MAGYNFYLNGIGVGGLNGVPKGLVNNSWANFGPRLGFAYDLTGQGKTVIRGGFGLTYERIQGNDMYNGAVNPPGDPNPTLNGVSLDNPGLNLGTGNTITAANLPILPLGVTGIATNYTPPLSSQYSLGVQQAVGTHAVLNISYVGSQGRHENYYQAVNLPPLSAICRRKVSKPWINQPGALNYQTLTYPGIGNMRLANDGANSKYNSLQTSLTGTVNATCTCKFPIRWLKRRCNYCQRQWRRSEQRHQPLFGMELRLRTVRLQPQECVLCQLRLRRAVLPQRLEPCRGRAWWLAIASDHHEESGAPVNLGVSGTPRQHYQQLRARPVVSGSISYPKTIGQWFNRHCSRAPALRNWSGLLRQSGIRCHPWSRPQQLRPLAPQELRLYRKVPDGVPGRSLQPFNHPQFKATPIWAVSAPAWYRHLRPITNAFDGRQFQLGLKLISRSASQSNSRPARPQFERAGLFLSRSGFRFFWIPPPYAS